MLSNFVGTDVYALFKKSFKNICNIHVQNEWGGGVKGRLNNALLVKYGFPYAITSQAPLWLVRMSHIP